MPTYRDPVFRSIMAQSPFRYVEGTTHPVYEGYMVPVLPSPMLGGYRYIPYTPGVNISMRGTPDEDYSEGEAMRTDIDNLYGQVVGLSQQMKDSLIAIKQGQFIDMYNNFKYRLNGLYNKAKALLDSWNNWWISSRGKDGTGVVDLDQMAVFHNQWKDMLEQHKAMAAEVGMVISDPKSYIDKYKDPGFFAKIQDLMSGSVKWLLIGGLVYFVVIKEGSPVHFTKLVGKRA